MTHSLAIKDQREILSLAIEIPTAYRLRHALAQAWKTDAKTEALPALDDLKNLGDAIKRELLSCPANDRDFDRTQWLIASWHVNLRLATLWLHQCALYHRATYEAKKSVNILSNCDHEFKSHSSALIAESLVNMLRMDTFRDAYDNATASYDISQMKRAYERTADEISEAVGNLCHPDAPKTLRAFGSHLQQNLALLNHATPMTMAASANTPKIITSHNAPTPTRTEKTKTSPSWLRVIDGGRQP